jgi:hypothetical protein
LPENQTFAKPVYNPQISQPVIHYQSHQLYQTQTMASSQDGLQEQNKMTSSNSLPQNQTAKQNQITTFNSSNNVTHNTQPMTQTAFGGFNFGMNNPVTSINLGSNTQNLNFIRRELVAPQLNKSSHLDQLISDKCWSVGKLPTREPMGIFGMPSQENSGKYSVNSHIFQNNYNAVIDRVKEILLKNSHDIEKIRQIKILLNIPLNDDMIKIEEE